MKDDAYGRIFADPTWYCELANELKPLFWEGGKLSDEQREKKNQLAQTVAGLLKIEEIALAKSGKNEDEERLPIDTIVIHHSHGEPEVSLDYINALGLLRLYAPVFFAKRKGLPIWSGHFFEGKQTFIAYHYLIRQDGTVHHTLMDDVIGWQAGNWEANRRSIGICFLDNLDQKRPTEAALQSAQNIIEQYKEAVVVGHCEVNPRTTCPGSLFLGTRGWSTALRSLRKI